MYGSLFAPDITMKLLTVTLLAVFAVSFTLPAAAAQPLLAPAELQPLTDSSNVRVIDIRPAAKYQAGHIPGAVSAPYAQWRGPANNPGQLPPIDALAALVRDLGLDADTHAVVVGSGQNSSAFGAAARVYWTLEYLGFNKLSILNGGFKAWTQAGLTTSTDVPEVTPTQYAVQLNKSIIATTPAVAARVDNPDVRLLDARPHEYYVGATKSSVAAVAGTIKGAVNLENKRWFKPGTATFVSPAKAQQIAQKRLHGSVQETISFCNTGHWAATNWFALSEVVGLDNVRLYPASLAEWTQNPELPMTNVPSRGEQLLRTLTGLFQ